MRLDVILIISRHPTSFCHRAFIGATTAVLGIGWYTALKVIEKRGPQKPPVEVMSPVIGDAEEGLGNDQGEIQRNCSNESFKSFHKEKEKLLSRFA